MKNDFRLKVITCNNDKLVFRGGQGWRLCLNADEETAPHSYSLVLNHLNFLKLKKINFHFPKKFSAPAVVNNEKKELRPYQQADVNRLGRLKSVAIFNEMRTGKTPTSLLLSTHWKVFNLLIIVPAILQRQWQTSVEEWLHVPAYIISQLLKDERIKFYEEFSSQENLVIIVSKEIFKADSLSFSEIRKEIGFRLVQFCVIIDEAHYLRNYESQQSKSIYSLVDSPYKIILTGTPIVNSYVDIFGILKFLNSQKYSSYWKFASYFFRIRENEFIKNGRKIFLRTVDGFKTRAMELQLKNEIASFSTNRRQKDVLPWLPAIIRHEEVLVMDTEQRELYNKWIQLSDHSAEYLIADLKSITLYPRHILSEIKTNGVKIEYLVDFCTENQEKHIIIFSTRTETFLLPLAELLKKKGLALGVVAGNINNDQKSIYIGEFQSSKLRILLCNIQSAGFGLDLHKADTIIFADRSYSPADNEQAEARFLPTQQSQSCNVKLIVDLVCKNTIDEKILKLLTKKKNIAKIIRTDSHLILG